MTAGFQPAEIHNINRSRAENIGFHGYQHQD